MSVALVGALAWPPMAVAAGPATTASVLVDEGFEAPSSPNYVVAPYDTAPNDGNAYWGRSNGRVHTGSYGLWNAGARPAGLPSAWPAYTPNSGGVVGFDLPQLADYYESSVNYWFIQPSMGAAEYNRAASGFGVLYSTGGVTGAREYGFPWTGVWLSRTHDTGVSRKAGNVQFQFYDDSSDNEVGEGPSIDDVKISGWKYGPVRNVTAGVAGSKVNLAWARPWSSTELATPEGRAISYRVFWAPDGTANWSESAVSRLGNSVTATAVPVPAEGQSVRFAVQAYDPAGDTGYGRHAEKVVAIPAVPPAASMSAPLAGFALTNAPVLIAGSSSDVGTGVSNVRVRIRRAGGLCWNGAGWVAADTWLLATSANSWATWSYSWTPDLATLAAGEIVTVSARATDGSGYNATTAGVSSASPMNASAALAGGAPYTTAASVSAAVSASGANYVRWRVDGGAPTAWQPIGLPPAVNLGAGDATKTVTFEFSTDGATTAGVASDSIVLHTSVPVAALTAPASGFALTGGTVNIAGTASDAGGGVSAVGVRVHRGDGLNWNGTSWVPADVWLPAASTNGFANWTAAFTPDAATQASGQSVTLTARATDTYGLTGSSAGVVSAVPVQASVTLAAGAAYTTSPNVLASIATTGTPALMRWKVDNGAFGSWVAFASSANVSLPPGDGNRTVTFEFSHDGGATIAASATDAITLHTSVPTVAFSGPAAGFSLTQGSVNIAGTASDVGGTVNSVVVRIRRGDGSSWTGSAWTAADTWLPASTANGFANWTASFTPDPDVQGSGEIVTLSARATDAHGLVGTANPGVASGVPVLASISLADGAASTTSRAVPVYIAATGAPGYMRFRIDGGPYGSWGPFATAANVTLPANDGVHTVTFDFSADGSTVSATASDTITLHTSVPTVGITAPAAGFAVNKGPVVVTGTSVDIGGAVAAADVRIRRSDGACWNGLGWTSSEFWLPATSGNGFATWTYTFNPDPTAIVAGKVITVTARATDSYGLSSAETSVSSSVPIEAAISVAGGAPYSVVALVPVAVSAAGATHMRWHVGAGAWSGWTPVAPAPEVSLGAGDGLKVVTFEFSADGSTASAEASDTIELHTSVPTVGLTSPAAGFPLNSGPVLLAGTAADVGGTVSGVDVRVRRSDGACWDGAGWVAADTWLPASSGNGFANWTYNFAPAASAIEAGKLVTVSTRATDARGLRGTGADVSSAVPISAAVVLGEGAPWTVNATIPVTVSSTGANRLQWRVGTGAWSSWVAPGTVATVNLGTGDGTKTVTFNFSSDNGVTVGATASDTIVLHTSIPAVAVSAPPSTFAVNTGAPITVSGTASDVGGTVIGVSVRVLRSDGKSWNGLDWTGTDTWLPATTGNTFANWTYSFAPRPADIVAGMPVTVAASATDDFGLSGSSAGVTSAVPIAASITVADGAEYTAATVETVTVACEGATHMRWRVAEGPWATSWVPTTTAASVALGDGDGPRTVTFEFSANGGTTVGAISSDVITVDRSAASPDFWAPAPGFSPQQGAISVYGHVADPGVGVSRVMLRIRRGGAFWDGTQWTASEKWLQATGTAIWSYLFADAAAPASYLPMAIDAMTEDALGNRSAPVSVYSLDPADPTALTSSASATTVNYGAAVSISGSLASQAGPLAGQTAYLQSSTGPAWVTTYPGKVTAANGSVSFAATPRNKTSYRVVFYAANGYAGAESPARVVTPRVSLSAPSRPSSAVKNRAFTVTGALKPRHTAGSYPVKVQCFRYASGKWVLKKTVSAKASNLSTYTRYTAKVSLPYTGKWKLRAVAPADTKHASTTSAYTTVFSAR